MNQCDKPFSCTEDNCKMTFTNEDHLNVHKRKHNMALHIGLHSPDSNTADQTPTPTRFIRNCEEVGLFQDLQNLNPFEETFRKAATELAKHGSLHIPQTSSNDDSLHTPHIFPHISQDEKYSTNSDDDFSVNNDILVIDENKINLHCDQSSFINNRCNSDQTYSGINEHTGKSNFPNVLGSNKADCSEGTSDTTIPSNVQPSNNPSNIIKRRVKSKHLIQIQKQREINRAAQMRSRAKKKMIFHKLVEEVSLLKCETKELAKENEKLKIEVIWLKTMLLYHKDCPVSKDPHILNIVNSLTRDTQEKLRLKKLHHSSTSTLVSIQPNPLVIAPSPQPSQLVRLQPATNSILLQVQPPINATLVPTCSKLTPHLPKPPSSTITSLSSKVNQNCTTSLNQSNLCVGCRSKHKTFNKILKTSYRINTDNKKNRKK